MSTHRKTWSKSEKLAVIHMANTEGVAKACRHYNVSQTSFYKWKAKLESLGESALDTRGGDQLSKQNAQLLSENRMLKQIIADKELKLMIQDELLKKKSVTTEVKRLVAQQFIDDGYPVARVLKILRLPRSSYYYRPQSRGGKGRRCSTHTLTDDGASVLNEVVIGYIQQILSGEFVDYGYVKVTYGLRQQYGCRINKKKVYRLMKQAGLLYKRPLRVKGKRLWVSDLVPQPQGYFSYLEFDIKYIWIAGQRRNALVLSVIDVFSRWVLGQLVRYSIRKDDVVDLFDQIFTIFPMPLRIYVRNDNGSQMESQLVQQYFADRQVTQEFTKPATPEQNAHIESYHSIIERVICSRYDFEDLPEAIDTFNRWLIFYNYERIHSGINYLSPCKYLLSMGIDIAKEIELKKALATDSPQEDLNRNTVQYLGG